MKFCGLIVRTLRHGVLLTCSMQTVRPGSRIIDRCRLVPHSCPVNKPGWPILRFFLAKGGFHKATTLSTGQPASQSTIKIGLGSRFCDLGYRPPPKFADAL